MRPQSPHFSVSQVMLKLLIDGPHCEGQVTDNWKSSTKYQGRARPGNQWQLRDEDKAGRMPENQASGSHRGRAELQETKTQGHESSVRTYIQERRMHGIPSPV